MTEILALEARQEKQIQQAESRNLEQLRSGTYDSNM